MASSTPYEFSYECVYDKLNGATVKVLLVDTNDAFTQATDKYVSDIVANEVSDASYARVTCTGLTITKNTNGHAVWVDVDDPTFSALDVVSPVAAYFYIHTGNDATAEIISRVDHADFTAIGSDITINISSTNGILYYDA